MPERRERNERIHQILVYLAVHDYCQGMTSIGRGVGMGYSTHLRKLLDLMVTLGYLRYADITAGSRTYRKWGIWWDELLNADEELWLDLWRIRRAWYSGGEVK